MKAILQIALVLVISISAHAQTSYGSGAGTQGISYSYFGFYAGNAAQSSSSDNSFIGTSSGRFTTTGFGNAAVGTNSLRMNTDGYWNTAIGSSAMHLNTSGFRNVAVGRLALYSNTNGDYNIGIGFSSMFSNTTGLENTAMGSRSLYGNTSGVGNVASGFEALYSNSSATYNTAVGYQTLYSNNGSKNTAAGYQALYSNLTGYSNVAAGANAMFASTSGFDNTAIGVDALTDNTTGNSNTAVGKKAMDRNTTGTGNSAFGRNALQAVNGSFNCAVGYSAMDSDWAVTCTGSAGSYNSAFGSYAGPTYNASICDFTNTTALGAHAVVTASNQVRIGDASVTSIGGQVSWTTLSDGRFKREIRSDVAGLDFINQLNPVSYVLDKKAINSFLRIPDSGTVGAESARQVPTRQIGFVAQEVDELVKKSGYVFSGVEVPQNDSDPYTIRYAEFVVPLVKAVQELTARLDEQQKQMMEKEETYQRELVALKETLRQHGVSVSPSGGAVLYQNNPNPYSGTTEIRMELPEDTRHARIIVYNLEGKQLKDIEVAGRGTATVNLSGSEFDSGMYLYALVVDGVLVDTKRLVLAR